MPLIDTTDEPYVPPTTTTTPPPEPEDIEELYIPPQLVEPDDSPFVPPPESEPEPEPEPVLEDPTADADTGTQSVIGEISEAFHEIAASFKGLQNAFVNFGSTLGVESKALGNKMQVSVGNIKATVGELTDKFKAMGDNLSNILKKD